MHGRRNCNCIENVQLLGAWQPVETDFVARVDIPRIHRLIGLIRFPASSSSIPSSVLHTVGVHSFLHPPCNGYAHIATALRGYGHVPITQWVCTSTHWTVGVHLYAYIYELTWPDLSSQMDAHMGRLEGSILHIWAVSNTSYMPIGCYHCTVYTTV